ncbi:MAG: protein kinase [Nitrospirota bacterium]|nr:protein kinase [Nitrospirota bacterium]
MFGLGLAEKREKAYSQRDWDMVISVARKQVQSDPQDIKALNDLAEAYYHKKMLTEAHQICQKINEVNPVQDLSRQVSELGVRYMRYHLVQGETYFARGNYDEALRVFERLRFLKGNLSDKFHRAAQIHVARGHADQAVNEYEQLWKWRPDRADLVLKGLQTVTEKFPRNPKAHRLVIEVLKKRGQLKDQVEGWEKAVRGGAKDQADLFRLGFYYQFEGQDAKAMELFTTYAQSHPDDDATRWFLADLLLERGQWDKALQEYRQLMEMSPGKADLVQTRLERVATQRPDNVPLQAELLSLALRRGGAEAARARVQAVLQTARASQPLRVELERILAAAAQDHADTGELDATHALLELLLLLDPTNPGYRAQLDQLASVMGPQRIYDMEERLKSGLLSEQEAFALLSELGELYVKQGEPDEKIIAVYQQLAKPNSPHQPDALFRLGFIFLRQGLIDLAENQFDKLGRLALPESVKAQFWYEIGMTFERIGQPDKARDYYKRTVEIDVNYRDVAQRLRQLPVQTPSANPALSPAPFATPAPQADPMAVVRERYDRIEKIGEGGMGSVFRAQDRVLKRAVALKFIKKDFQYDNEAVARFIREAQAASHLRHASIVAIYDIHVKEPIYIAMEFVEGGNLRDELKKGPWPVKQVLVLAAQICDALGYAHKQGVVHRDIKPDNILTGKGGGIKIADFGLARIEEGGGGMTRAGQVMGTPRYMAPEQILGKTVDGRTDQYAVGIMLYELLTGSVPFNEGDIAYRQIHETPTLPGVLNPAVPAALDAIVMTALAKRPEDRYPSMEAMGRDVQALG